MKDLVIKSNALGHIACDRFLTWSEKSWEGSLAEGKILEWIEEFEGGDEVALLLGKRVLKWIEKLLKEIAGVVEEEERVAGLVIANPRSEYLHTSAPNLNCKQDTVVKQTYLKFDVATVP